MDKPKCIVPPLLVLHFNHWKFRYHRLQLRLRHSLLGVFHRLHRFLEAGRPRFRERPGNLQELGFQLKYM